jgi:hypothetical protein
VKGLVHLLTVLIIAAAWPAAVLGDVYKYRDRAGRITLTDQPIRGGGYKLLKVIRLPAHSGGARRGGGDALRAMERRRDAVAPKIERIAEESRLSPELIHAVVRAESAYDPDAVSRKGAVGLMQLMPATAERYGVRDRRDPEQNLRGGSAYLRDLLDLFEGDLKLALAGYNAGENAVIRHGRRIPPYEETQTYVTRVLGFLDEYRSVGRLASN